MRIEIETCPWRHFPLLFYFFFFYELEYLWNYWNTFQEHACLKVKLYLSIVGLFKNYFPSPIYMCVCVCVCVCVCAVLIDHHSVKGLSELVFQLRILNHLIRNINPKNWIWLSVYFFFPSHELKIQLVIQGSVWFQFWDYIIFQTSTHVKSFVRIQAFFTHASQLTNHQLIERAKLLPRRKC
jgi:hypothetical protein